VNVNAVTVDFGGPSQPSHFDLWGGATPDRLPQSLAPGHRLILTMTDGFNFDGSDLLSEACNLNSGIVPVVHVTMNGQLVDYRDDHQILNTDGVDSITCPGALTEEHPYTVVSPGSQPAAGPKVDVIPSIVGVAATDRVLSGFAGAWNASPPPTLALQWLRCNASGTSCASIAGATSATYRPTAADAGRTLRLRVKGTNPTGTKTATSTPTPTIVAGPSLAQFGNTSTGATAIEVGTPAEIGSVFTASGSGTSSSFEFFARGAAGAQDFTPRIYSVVDGQPASLLATGATVTVPKGTSATWYVSDLGGVTLTAGTQYYLALAPSGVFTGTYVGSETNGVLSLFVDYTP
jgi:hypothetical protein